MPKTNKCEVISRTLNRSDSFYSFKQNVIILLIGVAFKGRCTGEPGVSASFRGASYRNASTVVGLARNLRNGCDYLPMRGHGELRRAVDVDWYYNSTVEDYDLDSNEANCCVSDSQIICLDGKGMVFGRFEPDIKKFTVLSRTVHCLTGWVVEPVSTIATYPDDAINNDMLSGYVRTGMYVLSEYGLNCSFSGKLPPLADDDINRYRDLMAKSIVYEKNTAGGCADFAVDDLPFRAPGPYEEALHTPWFHRSTKTYYGLDDECFKCFTTKEQVICTDGTTLVFGELSQADGSFSVLGRSIHCLDGNLNLDKVNRPTHIDDSIRNDILESRVTGENYVLEEFGLNCTVDKRAVRSLAASGSQCPTGVALRGTPYNRQAVSGVSLNNIDHIHSHSLHTMSISSCSASYNAYGSTQFSRHFGYGSGELLGTIMYCEDSFSGTQNPLVRLVSSSGFSSARAKARTETLGKTGCYYTTSTQLTAEKTACDGYANSSLFPTTYISGVLPSDEFWSAC